MKKLVLLALLSLSFLACSQENKDASPSEEGLRPVSQVLGQPDSLAIAPVTSNEQSPAQPSPSTTIPQNAPYMRTPDPINPNGGFGAVGGVNPEAQPQDTSSIPYTVLRFEQSVIEDSTTLGEIMNISNLVGKTGLRIPFGIEKMRSRKIVLKAAVGLAFKQTKPTARTSPTETFINGTGRCVYYNGVIKADLDIFRLGSEFFFEKKTERLGLSEAIAETAEFQLTEEKTLSNYVELCIEKYYSEVRKDLATQIATFAIKQTNRMSGVCDPTVGVSNQYGDSQCMEWFLTKYPCRKEKNARGQTVCKKTPDGFPEVDFGVYRTQYGSYPPDFSEDLIPRCVYQEKTKIHVCEERIRKNESCPLWEHNGKVYDKNPMPGFKDPIAAGFYGTCDKGLKCTLEGALNKQLGIIWGFHRAQCK